jgi:hypothetical protein
MSSFNYEFDFYTWEKDKICAEYISKKMTESAIKTALKYAIENNGMKIIHECDSCSSINAEELNEIHDTMIAVYKDIKNNTGKKQYFNCFKFCFPKK